MDGKPLGEKNPKWLQDDYVKFIRFGQWKIDQAGEGVLGFITNHSYLDNPTFRGMRRSLMNSFNEIYLLDLHGNSLKKEKCPDGSKDENVFDIRQGTAIALFIKTKDRNSENGKKVFHSELWGMRKEKYDWLINNDITTTKWQEIAPKSEFYLFVPRDEKLLEQYEKSPKITDIFPLNGVGMTTARDHFVIDMDKNRLINKIRLFKHSKCSDDELHEFFQIRKKKGWDIRKAWNMLQNVSDSDLSSLTLRVLYRPFDVRWIFYHDSVVWRTVKRVMRHMMQENLGLMTLRKGLPTYDYSWVFVSSSLVSHGVYYNGNQSTEYLFPLYLYPDPNKKDLFSHLEESKGKQPNINPKVFSALAKAYKTDSEPEDIFYYIYAVLYSNIYRTEYAEFLKTDFPRVPFTKDKHLFHKLRECGKLLVDLHLMQSPMLDLPIAKFQGTGDKRIEKIKYDKKLSCVYINKHQYFEGIQENIWQYRIGGYQVLSKWLKDRKGKVLSLDDVKHYCKITTAIQSTISIQKNIDETYREAEKEIIEF